MASFFQSKARTLQRLTNELSNATVLPMVIISYEEFKSAPDLVNQKIQGLGEHLIVRSSSKDEDSEDGSSAGVYDSILNVANIEDQVLTAIDQVFASYKALSDDDEVFIQPMLERVEFVGVAFSHEQTSGAPYFVINAATNGDTEAVTAGKKDTRTWYIKHTGVATSEEWQQKVCDLLNELQQRFASPVDVEFALVNGHLYLLQVRPLILPNASPYQEDKLALEFACIQKKINRIKIRHPKLLGEVSAYGVMPDWNPAEIIGIKPKPLALSIYQEIITNSVWAIQRHNYGYRDVVGFPLLTSLGGTPYIDVRASFNSFIPEQLETELAEKLVNYYMSQLHEQPELHDKVEFQIVLSCFTFDLAEKVAQLPNEQFSDADKTRLVEALTELTNQVIEGASGCFEQDLQKVEQLKHKQQEVLNSQLNKIDTIYWLLEDCKKYGTLPFAGLARAGFIAVQLLNSLQAKGVLSQADVDSFMLDVDSVSSQFMSDKARLSAQAMIDKYGHLRPGTYDICSARYDECPDLYLTPQEETPTEEKHRQQDFTLSLTKLNEINALLKQAGINTDAIGLLNFIKRAIEARESSKFVFSKSVSEVLESVKSLGKGLGYEAEDMAFCDLKDILNLTTTSHSAAATLSKSIALGREYFQLCQYIKLPSVLFEHKDIEVYEILAGQPNFITDQTFSGKVVQLAQFEQELTPSTLANKVIFIDSADPGYDWLFSANIGALVTKYGGINSHMAIRAAELGIPAIIGAGEKNYEHWRQATSLLVDCQNQNVEMY